MAYPSRNRTTLAREAFVKCESSLATVTEKLRQFSTRDDIYQITNAALANDLRRQQKELAKLLKTREAAIEDAKTQYEQALARYRDSSKTDLVKSLVARLSELYEQTAYIEYQLEKVTKEYGYSYRDTRDFTFSHAWSDGTDVKLWVSKGYLTSAQIDAQEAKEESNDV